MGRTDATVTEQVKLDKKDTKLLVKLSEDSRIPLTKLAKQIRLSRDGADYKLKRLAEKGIIIKIIPTIDLKYFGFFTYHVFMGISTHDKERKSILIKTLCEHANTKYVLEYSDTWDLEWAFVASSIQEFDAIISEISRKFSDVILEKEKLAIIKGFKSIHLPEELYKKADMKCKLQAPKIKPVSVDKYDLQILNILAQNARESTYQIAKKTKLSSDTVSYRLKKMITGGVVRQFTILPNLTLMGYNLSTFCINVKTFDNKEEKKLAQYINHHPYIIRAVKVFGDWDIMFHIVSPDASHFHQTVKEIQNIFTDVLIRHQIWIAYKEHCIYILPKIVRQKFGKGNKVIYPM